MRAGLVLLAIVSLLLVNGCAKDRPPVAALTPLSPNAGVAWGLPHDLTVTGRGNSCRVVQGASLRADNALELAAGGQGELAYYREIGASPDGDFRCRWQFLSTQGTGRIVLSAIDATGHTVATLGWVFTGRLPGDDDHDKWLDKKYNNNFQGGWLTLNGNPAALLSQYLPEVSLAGL